LTLTAPEQSDSAHVLAYPRSTGLIISSREGSKDKQDGSVTVERRKRRPDVWSFRWREPGPDGRRIPRRIVLGTAEDL